jgi:hypothetical protein
VEFLLSKLVFYDCCVAWLKLNFIFSAVLGFLSLPELFAESNTTGNYALLDQVAALKWSV